MVGDRDPAIREFAIALGLPDSAIRFRGEIPYNQVAKEMQEADSLIVFSNIENSPCVIAEALCCGLPVIATRVGGIPELVDQTNSILIEPRNQDLLVEAMKDMIGSKEKYDRPKIAVIAQGKFNYKVIGNKFDEMYNEPSRT